jgi:uncharacterized protein with beta-barrel porin domain
MDNRSRYSVSALTDNQEKQPMKLTPQKNVIMKARRISGFLFALLALAVTFQNSARAGSADWITPTTGDWNTAGNWTPATVPNGPADVATFSLSAITGVSISANTQVNGIVFDATATSPYTITIPATFTMTISGAGITNNSGVVQNFVTANGVGFGTLAFTNSATAGTLTTITNLGGTAAGPISGLTTFNDTSTAGSATINNTGGSGGGIGGETDFNGTSALVFPTAGTSTINNNAAVDALLSTGGFTVFNSFADAGTAIINNQGGTGPGVLGGTTTFNGTSTADTAVINNNAGATSGFGGATTFNATSTAATSTINNNGGTDALGGTPANEPGSTTFNTGAPTFANPLAGAGTATISNNGGTAAGAFGGVTNFNGTSSAGGSTITNSGGTGAGSTGGVTNFNGTSTAFTPTLVGLPANIPETAATLIALGGTNGGGGGTIFFNAGATGGDATGGAQVQLNGNGALDIHNSTALDALGFPGVTIGSLSSTGVGGGGNVFLGTNELSILEVDATGTSNSTVFSGVIQGTGDLSIDSVDGLGKLELDADSTYSGGTFIDSGTLVANSIQALGTGFVSISGGVLETKDDVPRTVNIGVPGVTVANLNIFATGTLRAQFGQLVPGVNTPGVTSDLFNVTGGTFIANAPPANSTTLLLHKDTGFFPPPTAIVDVIETPGAPGGLVNGTFTTVDAHEFKGLVQPTVFYDVAGDKNAFGVAIGDGDNDAVIVDFELAKPFISQALTRNQRAVAETLDEAVGDPRAAQLLGFVGALPLNQLPGAFDLIAPEQLTEIYEVRFSTAVQRDQNLERRMDDIRAGSNGFSGAGFAPQVTGPAYSKDSSGKAVLDKNPAPAFVPTPENPWGIWVTGQGQYVNVGNDDDNAEGFNLSNGGVTAGVDYRVTQHLAIGLFGAYDSGRGDENFSSIGGQHSNFSIDTGTIGGYGTFSWAGFYLDVAGSGGWSSFNTDRVALVGHAKGDSTGNEYNAMVAVGYDWRFGCLSVGPTASFQYTDVNINQYSERGSLAPLNIEDQDEDSLRSTVGVRAAYDWKVGSKGVIFRPELRVAWLHEYSDEAYPIRSHLTSGAADSFTVFGPTLGRDAAQIGAGLSVHYNPHCSIYVAYDGVVGRGNYDANGASGGVTFSF